jgi:hypothetical protein
VALPQDRATAMLPKRTSSSGAPQAHGDGGGPKGARRQIWEARTRQRITKARARCWLLGGAYPRLAPAGIPPPATTLAFPRHVRR